MSDIRTLDFNLLKAFVVLLDECNVSRAAQRLSITQPAMSGILNRLRESFNDPLFVRVQHGMQPTDRALQLGKPHATFCKISAPCCNHPYWNRNI